MGTTWSKLREGITEGIRNVSEKTGEMTKIGRLKIEIVALKRDIEKAFIELGGRVYHKLENKETDIHSDLRIKKLIKDIKSFETKLRDCEEKMEKVREHRLVKD
jgi:hypothetical protein